jgi:hypothetical protein
MGAPMAPKPIKAVRIVIAQMLPGYAVFADA